MSYDASCCALSRADLLAASILAESPLLSDGLRGPSLSSALPAPVKEFVLVDGVAELLAGDEGVVVMVSPSEIPTLNTRGTLTPWSPKLLATETDSLMLLENVRGALSVPTAASCRCVREGSAKA
jgi:hypothetical protein